MKQWFAFWHRHLYVVLMIVSMLGMSVTGLVMMPAAGETYGQQEALAGTAIHMIKEYLSGAPREDEMIDFSQLGSGSSVSDPIPAASPLDGQVSPLNASPLNGADAGSGASGEGSSAGSASGNGNPVGGVSGNDVSGNGASGNSVSGNGVNGNGTAAGGANGSDSLGGSLLGGLTDTGSGQETGEDSLNLLAANPNKVLPAPVEATDYLAPNYTTVDDSYFDDAVFIGDSRSQGFCYFSQLPNVTCYSVKALSITKVSSKAFIADETAGRKLTIPEALQLHAGEFKKVYIMFGINEIGWGNNGEFEAYYMNLIDYIKETQPDAVIYVQSVIHVTAATAAMRPAFANSRIDERNARLAAVAAQEHVYYLDLNEIFTDDSGALQANAASDGIHLNASYILLWKEYLKAHAIVR